MAACDFEDILQEATSEILRKKFPEIEILNEEQRKALWGFIARKDVFAILPTGYGKSLIFQLVPDLCSYLNSRGYAYPKTPIVIVICPINSLIDSHMRELEKHDITATRLTGEDVDEKGIIDGKYSIIFANPEAVIKNEKWHGMLQNKVYQSDLFGIVTDEAHVIPKWGQDNTKEKTAAFRECFARLGELRSLAPKSPIAPVLSLTATATRSTKKEVIKSLGLRKDRVEITISPNRSNIYLYTAKVSKDNCDGFGWLVEKVKQETIALERTIVYCKSIKDCGKLFAHFKDELKDDAYYPVGAEKVSQNMLIGMYHHTTLKKNKERVVNSFSNDGTCRLVFSTNALGMGVNFNNVRFVVHYGPPRHIEDFVQEIGRAGRDKQPATSVLLYSGIHLRKCDAVVKHYAKSSEKCLREIILDEFKDKSMPEKVQLPPHSCCMVCHNKCNCSTPDKCKVPMPEYGRPESAVADDTAEGISREVTKRQKELLTELLTDYKTSLMTGTYYLTAESSTGFTDTPVCAVVKKCRYIFYLDYIIQNLPVFKLDHAVEILCMIKDVFEDIDNIHVPERDNDDWHFNYDFEYGGHYDSDSSSCSNDSELSLMSGFEFVDE